MSEKFEERFIKPIINASFPGTLAGLSVAGLAIGTSFSILRYSLSLSAVSYLLSSFSIFFYTIYTTKRIFWTVAAISFLSGLTSSLASVVLLAVLG